MSIDVTARSIMCKTPGQPMQVFNDASPHIQNYRIKAIFSGVREYDDGTYIFKETLSGTFENAFARKSIRGSLSVVVEYGFGIEDDIDDTGADVFDIYYPLAGDFTAEVDVETRNMAKQQVRIYLPSVNETIGSHEQKRKSDGVVISSGNIIQTIALPPVFTHSIPPLNSRTSADRWGIAPGVTSHWGNGLYTSAAELDLSGWSVAQWRALTGINTATFNETSWDIGTGGTSTVQAEYEWELS